MDILDLLDRYEHSDHDLDGAFGQRECDYGVVTAIKPS